MPSGWWSSATRSPSTAAWSLPRRSRHCRGPPSLGVGTARAAAGPVPRPPPGRTTWCRAPTGTAMSCARCTGGPPPAAESSWCGGGGGAGADGARRPLGHAAPRGELMVRREEQRGRHRAVLRLDTRARAHGGTGAGSSFEYAVSAAASIGVHLARAGLEGQLATDQGAVGAHGTFEDVLLDSLAVIKTSRGTELTNGLDGIHGAAGGLLVAVAGRLTPAQARKLAASRRDVGTAMALLLAVPSWAAAAAAAGMPDQTGGAAAILRAARWRAVTVSAETPLSVAWEQLHHAADLPAGGPGGRFPAGAPQ